MYRFLSDLFMLFATVASADEAKITQFGAPIELKSPVAITQVLKDYNKFNDKEIQVTGVVEKVCVKKGCWLTLKTDSPVRVTFKDYGFFVPAEILGKKVLLQGKMSRTMVSVEDQKHYLKDEKASPEEIAKITEPKAKFRFTAAGVKIL